MELERRPAKAARRLPLPAAIAVGALAVFGAITMVQWFLASVLGVIKFALMLVVVVAVGLWIVGIKGRR